MRPISYLQSVLPAQQIILALDIETSKTNIFDEIGAHISKLKGVYLTFDNAEWNLETIHEVLPILLEKAPNLTAVITGRKPLGLQGEKIVHLDKMCEVDALKLVFNYQATQTDPDFQVGPGDPQRMLDIVRTFDCVPMAIKTIASKVNQFSLERLHGMIQDSKDNQDSNSLDTALLFIWLSLPSFEKTPLFN